ncbi:aminopeptidase P family protein [Thermoflexus sp.]|uniref:M24 family metallopeptidase n=1 Tax=Thermoflexus sp. TaxID=1969742 RepID=UPI002ADDFD4E|nr:aminopeptidase P family protein [Thermoflexus sp.]
MAAQHRERVEAVRHRMAEENLEAVFITYLPNVRYLSGFTGSAAVLCITPSGAWIMTDFRYWEQAAREAPDFTLYRLQSRRFVEILPEFLGEIGSPRRVAFESAHLTVDQWMSWKEATPEVEWVPIKDWIEALRAVKDIGELARIREAARIADATVAYLRRRLRPGMTEREAAWLAEQYLRTHGGDDVAFDVIVASGPNAAMAHHHPGDRRLRIGEPIIVDLGARVDGYHSDITRTFVLGRMPRRFQELYTIVLRAQEAAIRNMRAGMPGKEIDALARAVIEEAGYADAFGHGLGHGVGLEIHEKPSVGPIAEDPIPAGAVFTVEPGIYIRGWGGIRIEDMVVIGTDGVREVLTCASRDPLIPAR